MEHTRKLMVVPYTGNSHTEPKIEQKKKNKSVKEKSLDKMNKILTIILKLAKIGGYDEYGRIYDKGVFLENSSISALILNALTPGRILTGESEFIELLSKAKIDPDMIVNDNVKAKLIKMNNSRLNTEDINTNDEPIVNRDVEITQPVDRVIKRSHDSDKEIDDEYEHTKSKRVKREQSVPNEVIETPYLKRNREDNKRKISSNWYLPSDTDE